MWAQNVYLVDIAAEWLSDLTRVPLRWRFLMSGPQSGMSFEVTPTTITTRRLMSEQLSGKFSEVFDFVPARSVSMRIENVATVEVSRCGTKEISWLREKRVHIRLTRSKRL